MTHKPVIESGIAIPARKSGGPRGNGKNQQLLRSMNIGDSCYIAKPQHSVSTTFREVGKKLQMKVITRREGDGTRLWRTQ